MNATVYGWTETLNELGIWDVASTWTTIVNITGYLEQLSKRERFIEGTDRIFGTHRFFTAVNTSIKETHRIKIGSIWYDIQAIDNPMELNHHYEIIMERVQ